MAVAFQGKRGGGGGLLALIDHFLRGSRCGETQRGCGGRWELRAGLKIRSEGRCLVLCCAVLCCVGCCCFASLRVVLFCFVLFLFLFAFVWWCMGSEGTFVWFRRSSTQSQSWNAICALTRPQRGSQSSWAPHAPSREEFVFGMKKLDPTIEYRRPQRFSCSDGATTTPPRSQSQSQSEGTVVDDSSGSWLKLIVRYGSALIFGPMLRLLGQEL